MKLHNGKACLESADVVKFGLTTIGNLYNINSEGRNGKKTRGWNTYTDPENGKNILVVYDDLSEKNKEKVQSLIGNPYDALARQPIADRVVLDAQAQAFFIGYRYDNGQKSLDVSTVKKYTRAASWLKMLAEVQADRKIIKKGLQLTVPEFYGHVAEMITLEIRKGQNKAYEGWDVLPTKFPATYQRLMQRVDKYVQAGYESIIDPAFGNQAAAKVLKDDVSQDLLIELFKHPNQYDDVFICQAYNQKAKELGRKEITWRTVRLWREKMAHEITADREGWVEWRQKYSLRTHRLRPSQPGYLWESDDNHLDLLFKSEDGRSQIRYKGIFVTDSFSDLVLGYACAEELTTDQVRMAYLDAMHYVRSLTGVWCLPFEVRTDRWRLKSLKPFYEAVGHYDYIESPVQSKNRGWLENLFGSDDWKRCLKFDAEGLPANNYTGNNITARKAGFNREASRRNSKLFPLTMDAEAQISAFVNRLRHIDLHGKGSREQRWLEAWVALPESEKRIVTDEQMLLIFGLKQADFNGGRQTEITKDGICLQVGTIKTYYQIPPALRLQNIGKQVDLFFDPYDMQRVLVTDGERLRFVAEQVVMVPGTQRDMELLGAGSRAKLNEYLREKRDDVDRVTGATDRRRDNLNSYSLDPEYVLRQGGSVKKEIYQAAERYYITGTSEGSEFNPADRM